MEEVLGQHGRAGGPWGVRSCRLVIRPPGRCYKQGSKGEAEATHLNAGVSQVDPSDRGLDGICAFHWRLTNAPSPTNLVRHSYARTKAMEFILLGSGLADSQCGVPHFVHILAAG